MPISVTELKPCTILAFEISRHGGQRYERANEVKEINAETGEEVSRWETKKFVADAEELKEAGSIQHKAKYALSKLGARSPLGVILRRDKREQAEAALEEWEAEVAKFNATAKHCSIDFMAMVFDVEGRNVVQLERVIDQMFDLLGELKEALSSYEPENIRKVLAKASGFADILPREAAEAFNKAVAEARAKATAISKANTKAARIAAKIEEETSGMNPKEVLRERESTLNALLNAQDYASRAQIPKLRKRAQDLRTFIEDQEEVLNKLEQTKQEIDFSVVNQARFAVMRRKGVVETPDATAELQGAETAARLGRVGRVA